MADRPDDGEPSPSPSCCPTGCRALSVRSSGLDLIDLRRGRLRFGGALGDDVHRSAATFPARRGRERQDAARLVGGQVTATSEAVLGLRGPIVMLVDAVVERLGFPNRNGASMSDVDLTLRPLSRGVELARRTVLVQGARRRPGHGARVLELRRPVTVTARTTPSGMDNQMSGLVARSGVVAREEQLDRDVPVQQFVVGTPHVRRRPTAYSFREPVEAPSSTPHQ